jgi:transcriptional regulator of acetoin/glycerol metabolism
LVKSDQIDNAQSAAILTWSTFALLLLAAAHGQQPKKSKPQSNGATQQAPKPTKKIVALHQLEKEAIVSALTVMKGDKSLAARELGIGKTTLYRKLKKYGIVVEPSIAVRLKT